MEVLYFHQIFNVLYFHKSLKATKLNERKLVLGKHWIFRRSTTHCKSIYLPAPPPAPPLPPALPPTPKPKPALAPPPASPPAFPIPPAPDCDGGDGGPWPETVFCKRRNSALMNQLMNKIILRKLTSNCIAQIRTKTNATLDLSIFSSLRYCDCPQTNQNLQRTEQKHLYFILFDNYQFSVLFYGEIRPNLTFVIGNHNNIIIK